jgi:acyl-CoA reductase-like NAD-dependent aldehyde dehydrogenase
MTMAELMPMLRQLSWVDKLQVIEILTSELTHKQGVTSSDRRAFMQLPLEKRRAILQAQAEAMISHYEQDSEWRDLETGDIVEY